MNDDMSATSSIPAESLFSRLKACRLRACVTACRKCTPTRPAPARSHAELAGALLQTALPTLYSVQVITGNMAARVRQASGLRRCLGQAYCWERQALSVGWSRSACGWWASAARRPSATPHIDRRQPLAAALTKARAQSGGGCDKNLSQTVTCCVVTWLQPGIAHCVKS